MSAERILITVKTYPTLSRKYGETVCTAGLRDDGSWVRLYPMPFRRIEQQYKKFDWIQCRLVRHAKDRRPESFRPVDLSELRSIDHLSPIDGWRERRRLVLDRATVHTSFTALTANAKANLQSLAIFKPNCILDFVAEEDSREWDTDRLREVRERSQQAELFAEDAWRQTFKLIRKLPYAFSYRFQDDEGKPHELQVLDWETGALFWNCLRRASGDEQAAIAKVRQKYIYDLERIDLHFFLGTTLQYQSIAPNPWIIIGVFPAPHQHNLSLF